MSKLDSMLTLERARELFDYDATTGVITRKADGRRAEHEHRGYLKVRADGVVVRAHRLAWLLHTGAWPDGVIDHINRRKDDNRVENLRVVTDAQNRQNQHGPRKNNKLGIRGVSFNPKRGQYQTQIMVAGRLIRLGFYDDPMEASAVYEQARQKHHPFLVRQ